MAGHRAAELRLCKLGGWAPAGLPWGQGRAGGGGGGPEGWGVGGLGGGGGAGRGAGGPAGGPAGGGEERVDEHGGLGLGAPAGGVVGGGPAVGVPDQDDRVPGQGGVLGE